METVGFDQSSQFTELLDRLEQLEAENHHLRIGYQEVEFKNTVLENVILELGLKNDENVDDIISKNNFTELYESLLEVSENLDELREIERQYRNITNSFIGRKILWLWNFYYRLRSRKV